MVSTARLGDGHMPSRFPPPPRPLLSTLEKSWVGRAEVHPRAVNDVAVTNHAAIRILPLSRVVLIAYTRVAAKRVQFREHTRAQIQLGGGQVLQPLRIADNTIRRPGTWPFAADHRPSITKDVPEPCQNAASSS